MHTKSATRPLLALIVLMTAIAPSVCRSQTSSPGRPSASNPAGQNHAGSVIYTNRIFGFRFYLPASWKGFKIIEKTWDGENRTNGSAEQGPLILIRHPRYETGPREDIPIMVFTRAQWRRIEDESLSVSAAPFPPGEMGRNGRYVFAAPPRYYDDELEGVEEVIHIINSGLLHPMQPAPAH
ncbi:MAG: hypothetical protein WBF42_10500 [Terracidiphilus sp.]